jgi:hypothetical protein
LTGAAAAGATPWVLKTGWSRDLPVQQVTRLELIMNLKAAVDQPIDARHLDIDGQAYPTSMRASFGPTGAAGGSPRHTMRLFGQCVLRRFVMCLMAVLTSVPEAKTRDITISNIACRMRSGSRRSGIASASCRQTPCFRSASRRSTRRHWMTGCRRQNRR